MRAKPLIYLFGDYAIGNQACPVTSGTDYIVNNYGIWNDEWVKWIMAVCVMCWWLIFTFVTYIGIRFVTHTPPKKQRMTDIEISEQEELEMRQFDIKAVKSAHMKEEEGKDGHQDLMGGAYLSWHHLNYSVSVRSGMSSNSLQLLHDVSGYVKPGMMLALMVNIPLP